ncbi:MAG: carboxypeptidase-like regulatory domain-containing protein [Bacteroidetes bacterium]|nr:carboxypeptidase-like regulatory domain-containing protein [Bacteroidota bacterium]
MFTKILKLAFAFLLIAGTVVHAQVTGILTGRVVDKETGEALIGANVIVPGTSFGASTDIDGNFRIQSIPVGKIDLKISYVSFETKILTGIQILSGKVTNQNISLVPDDLKLDEVVVEASGSGESEGYLLLERKKATSIVDAISAEQIKKTPDSNAGDAMKRVTGVTVSGGKYVYVRGLGERYSNTQLNGAGLPSPEPEKKVVPFDLFPSNLIQKMVTVKTFSPDQPGDFAGGSVQISTVEFPDKEVLSYGISSGFNSGTHFQKNPVTSGGKYDFIGVDDGSRKRPSSFSDLNVKENQTKLAKDLGSNYGYSNQYTRPNQSYSVTYGKQFDLAGIPIGMIGSGTYSNDNSYREESLFMPSAQNDDPQYDLTSRNSVNNVLWGLLFNVSGKLTSTDKLSLKTMYNNSSENETEIEEGIQSRSGGGLIRASKQKFVSRGLFSSQLSGDHLLPWFLATKLEWKTTYSTATRSEPDNRETIYVLGTDNQYYYANNYGAANGRFFSDLSDQEFGFKSDFTTPFEQWDGFTSSLKYGFLIKRKTRSSENYRLQYGLDNQALANLNPEKLLTSDRVESGDVSISNSGTNTDAYDAKENHMATYIMTELPIYPGLRFVGGIRTEYNGVLLDSYNPVSGESVRPDLNVDKSSFDLLFSSSLIYSLSEEANIRVAAAKTLARPEFRELAPIQFYDFKSGFYGNPFLKDVSIMNYDARWEWFFRPGDILAVSAFMKTFKNPIEMVLLEVSSSSFTVPLNADEAVNYGLEFEQKFGLDLIHESLSDFKLSTNLTLVKSETSFSKSRKLKFLVGDTPTEFSTETLAQLKRPLQGQSPYVINAGLSYSNEDWGTNAMLLFNRFGERIHAVGSKVGTFKAGDVYELARNQVDFTASQEATDYLTVKISLKNIMNADYIYKLDKNKATTRSYQTGVSGSVGVSFNF